MRPASSRAKSWPNNNALAFYPLTALHPTIECVCLRRSLFSHQFPLGHSKCRLWPRRLCSTPCGPHQEELQAGFPDHDNAPLRSLLLLTRCKNERRSSGCSRKSITTFTRKMRFPLPAPSLQWTTTGMLKQGHPWKTGDSSDRLPDGLRFFHPTFLLSFTQVRPGSQSAGSPACPQNHFL